MMCFLGVLFCLFFFCLFFGGFFSKFKGDTYKISFVTLAPQQTLSSHKNCFMETI